MNDRLQPSGNARPEIGIVHLGLGAFYRAHGAIYTEEAIAAAGGSWGILGVSLQRPNQRDLLAPQGFAYTSVEMEGDVQTPTVREVIRGVLVAPEDPGAVLAAMADPQVKIVSLTVTEKGYCHEPSTGRLNRKHPDIVHDLANPDAPRSAIGFIVHALEMRRKAGSDPFTVMCCDNLPNNGNVVAGVVLEFAGLVDEELMAWITEKSFFPCTMVDRIVPATTEDDIAALSQSTGALDLSPVFHEPFRQWVIEDDFVNEERPAWHLVGAQIVGDVAPFEDMKLRCLNGTHSSLAYLGYLAGHETISATVADPAFASYVRHLWTVEIIPGLETPEGEDLPAYAEALFARYANTGLQHRTWQIAMDGSQKLPQRILGTIADNYAAGRNSDGLILAVAGWIKYVSGQGIDGVQIDVKDPLASRLQGIHGSVGATADLIDGFLALGEVFDSKLARNQGFRDALISAYDKLAANGAAASVAEFKA